MNALATAGPVALRQSTQRLSPLALVFAVLAHMATVFALLAPQDITLLEPVSALMVSLVTKHTPARQAVVSPVKSTTATPKPAPHLPQQRAQPTAVSPLLSSEGTQATPSFESTRPDKSPAQSAHTAQSQPASTAAAAVSATASASSAATSTATNANTSPSASAQTQAPSAPRFDVDYLDNPAPVYPPLSRRGAEQGTVMLSVYVEAGGQAAKVELRSSSGYERLDRAAIAAVSRWKFVPARQGADAVAAWVVVPIVFSLKV